MSKGIELLERLGQDANLRYATGIDLDRALMSAQATPALRAALLQREPHDLEALLGASANLCCMIHPAEEPEEPEEEPGEEDDDDGEDESDDDEN